MTSSKGRAVSALFLFFVAIPLNQAEADSELGDAAALFSGPLEVVSNNPDFVWLESPLWSDEGEYLLFSDVKYADEEDITCGMIWKFDEKEGVTEFLRCAGLVGPGEAPENIADYVEAGPNGLVWGWGGDGKDLIVCQHGMHRIVRFDPDDVVDGSIESDQVTVLVDKHNGTGLNSPNDVYFRQSDGTLFFTDPPFGRQYFSAANATLEVAYANATQDIGVYTISGDPGEESAEPTRILNFGRPNPSSLQAPNGVAVTVDGDLVLPITNFDNPRFEVYAKDGEKYASDPLLLLSEYRIKGNNSGFPALNDGITYSPELGVLFGAGPGGVYIYNSTTYDLLGLLRVDDLNSNNVVGGGYLWITANTRLLRIPLVGGRNGEPLTDTMSDSDSSANAYDFVSYTVLAVCVGLAYVLSL